MADLRQDKNLAVEIGMYHIALNKRGLQQDENPTGLGDTF